MPYVMESEKETLRLIAQEGAEPALRRLVEAGLGPGQRALDAGCGPGVVAQSMLELVGPAGEVTALDQSAERVGEARRRFGSAANARALQGDIHRMDFPDGRFDFVWSQFVFEYLREPQRALAELIRVTQSGGKVVVADCDGSGILNFPCEPELERELARLFSLLGAQTGFDLHVGRKMFHHFKRAGMREVRVRVEAQFVIEGAAEARMVEDWRIRFAALEPAVAPQFGERAYARLAERYLAMLEDVDSLKYGILLVTEGRRP